MTLIIIPKNQLGACCSSRNLLHFDWVSPSYYSTITKASWQTSKCLKPFHQFVVMVCCTSWCSAVVCQYVMRNAWPHFGRESGTKRLLAYRIGISSPAINSFCFQRWVFLIIACCLINIRTAACVSFSDSLSGLSSVNISGRSRGAQLRQTTPWIALSVRSFVWVRLLPHLTFNRVEHLMPYKNFHQN